MVPPRLRPSNRGDQFMSLVCHVQVAGCSQNRFTSGSEAHSFIVRAPPRRDDSASDSRKTTELGMSEWQTTALLVEAALKWRELTERRHEHFVDMFHSGRWKHYYTEEQFLRYMRESIRLKERWSLIAPLSAYEPRPEAIAPTASDTSRDAA